MIIQKPFVSVNDSDFFTIMKMSFLDLLKKEKLLPLTGKIGTHLLTKNLI